MSWFRIAGTIARGVTPALLTLGLLACRPDASPRTSTTPPGPRVPAAAAQAPENSGTGQDAPARPAAGEPSDEWDAAIGADVEAAERALAERGPAVPVGTTLRLACCVATSVSFGPIGVPLVWERPVPTPFEGVARVETGHGLGFGTADPLERLRVLTRPLDVDAVAAEFPARRARAERDLTAALDHAARLGRHARWAERLLEVIVAMPRADGTARVYVHARRGGDDDTLEVALDAGGTVVEAYEGPSRRPAR